MPDWSVGTYERTAEQLAPAARELIERAAPRPGERVVDVGCGTGNAALLAASRGARVTGVDPASRLLEVARARAAEAGLDVTFAEGEAAALPVDRADLVISVFGVIFAPDARAAARELQRVADRVVISAWIPGGAVSKAVGASREAVTKALGQPSGPPPFAWHDRDALATVFDGRIELDEREIAFTAPSPGEFLDGELDNHPLAIASRQVLEPRGALEPLRERMLAIYEAANEDPGAFKVTSRYVIATITKD
jgi:SAM-dependent methyltransferase